MLKHTHDAHAVIKNKSHATRVENIFIHLDQNAKQGKTENF